jgi:polyisoprenoid-binding protein YceI
MEDVMKPIVNHVCDRSHHTPGLLRGFTALALAGAAFAQPTEAAPLTLDRAASVFAVVTRKDGVAAAMAHDHFIVAEDFNAIISIEGDDWSRASAQVEVDAKSLKIDEPAAYQQWLPALKAAGLLAQASEVDADDRATIAATMIGDDQLDVATFPKITGRLERFHLDAAHPGHFTAELTLVIHGKTLTRTAALTVDRQANGSGKESLLAASLTLPLKFSDFGIEPFHAFLGAVRNRDDFTLFVRIRATAAAPAVGGRKP